MQEYLAFINMHGHRSEVSFETELRVEGFALYAYVYSVSHLVKY